MREGDWKLVMKYDTSRMELYNPTDDRAEKQNVAASHPEIVERLLSMYIGSVKEGNDKGRQ